MRKDSIGFFWEDHEKVKPPKKEVVKRTPPPRTWEAPDYLPGLEEALRFDVPLFSWEELFAAAVNQEELLFDLEVYPNYFLAAFCSYKTGKVTYVEGTPDNPVDTQRLQWMMETFTTVGFNSLSFDMPITAMAVAGCTNQQLKQATNMIILDGMQRQDVLKHFKVKKLQKCNHIDLIEVAPLRASLKIYGGRLHCPKMQDLPFHPETVLSPEQIAIVRFYCINDLCTTGFLRNCLTEAMELRIKMSEEYGIDLRSKSDAQIAEVVISDAVGRMNGYRPQRPTIEVGTAFNYKVPHFIKYESALLNWMLDTVRNTPFIVGEHGSINLPDIIADMPLDINGSVYRMGIGGLHSSEQKQCYVADDKHILRDFDVVSFYPKIILNQGLYPTHLGPAFLSVYKDLVDTRIAAKAAGRKSEANSRKIIINGTFGKLGSKYSILYAPDLLIQVTLTGQLVLLMLIERMERAGIHVVSANTDGIVMWCPVELEAKMQAIVKQWEKDTSFETEETAYTALYSRDVNNYIAVKAEYDKAMKRWTNKPDGTKNKGAFANPWKSAKDPSEKLHKNPANSICVEAVEAFLIKGVPVIDTIKAATDVRKFVNVRNVTGGAVQDGEYLGKSVRWYYSTDTRGEMVYAKNGNKVPRSDGARPVLSLPQQLPQDIDFAWYESEAFSMLSSLGYSTGSLDVKKELQGT